jgi:hypothetical protein
MIVSVPLGKLELLYKDLEKNQYTRHRFPILYDFENIPFPIPHEVMRRKYPHLW